MIGSRKKKLLHVSPQNRARRALRPIGFLQSLAGILLTAIMGYANPMTTRGNILYLNQALEKKRSHVPGVFVHTPTVAIKAS